MFLGRKWRKLNYNCYDGLAEVCIAASVETYLPHFLLITCDRNRKVWSGQVMNGFPVFGPKIILVLGPKLMFAFL